MNPVQCVSTDIIIFNRQGLKTLCWLHQFLCCCTKCVTHHCKSYTGLRRGLLDAYILQSHTRELRTCWCLYTTC